MERYYLHLLQKQFDWRHGEIIKNVLIALHKPEQNFNKDLSHIFSNLNKLDDEVKIYASSVADDLFTEQEVIDLLRFFMQREGVKLIISKRVILPIEYDGSGGIGIVPAGGPRETIEYRDENGKRPFSFMLCGALHMDNRLINYRDIEKISSKKDISDERLREMLLEL